MATNTATTEAAALNMGSPFDNIHAVRSFAMNAGQFAVLVSREVARVMAEHKNNQAKSIHYGIDRLLQAGCVSEAETATLKKIANLVLGATRQGADVAQAAAEAGQLYHGLMMISSSSPVALAIASAASSSLSAQHESTMTQSGHEVALASVTITPAGPGTGAVIGGILGGLFGSVFGPIGAGVGAGIGAAAGAGIGYCNQHNV